ncbi:hypothetical protein [Microcoleus vaginatus]
MSRTILATVSSTTNAAQIAAAKMIMEAMVATVSLFMINSC